MNFKKLWRYHGSLIFLGLLCLVNFTFASDDAIVVPEVTLKPHKNYIAASVHHTQVSGFTRKQIAISPDEALSGLLHQQSIVRVANNSADSNQLVLSIRGFGDNAGANSLILVDGFPLTNPTLLAPNFNALSL